MLTYAWLAAGGAFGTMARYWINLLFTSRFGEALPWGTIFANISGSFAIGLLAALTEAGGRFPVPTDIRSFLVVGLCGGYTTFSSFSLQTLALIETGEPGRALVNVLLSVTMCVFAVWLGATLPDLLARLFRS